MNIYKKWVLTVLSLLVSMLLVYVGIFEWCLHRINENYTQDEIMDLQLHAKSLFGSVLTERNDALKYPIGMSGNPDLVVLGSSRSMHFRRPFFRNISFYNFGLSGSSLNDMNYAADYILERHVPEIAIIGLDLWHLDARWVNATRHVLAKDNVITSRQHLYASLCKKLLTKNNDKVWEAIRDSNIAEYDVLGKRKTIGLRAAGYTQTGFREDGSCQWGEVITAPSSYDEKMENTRSMIKNGTSYFMLTEISPSAISQFEELLEKFTSKGCKVVVVITPFPIETCNTLRGIERYNAYVNDFLQTANAVCKKENVECYDFFNPALLGAERGEILDGFHASEKTYIRMLLTLRDSILTGYINAEYISKCLDRANNPFYVIPFDE